MTVTESYSISVIYLSFNFTLCKQLDSVTYLGGISPKHCSYIYLLKGRIISSHGGI